MISLWVFDLQREDIPNQQIQWSDAGIQQDEQNPPEHLDQITRLLVKVGATDVKAHWVEGRWSITYYIDLSPMSIQELLDTNWGSENKKDLDLAVTSIGAPKSSDIGMDGKSIVEAKQDLQRATDLKYNSGTQSYTQDLSCGYSFFSLQAIGTTEFSLERRLQEVPETRAGPRVV